MDVVLDCRKPMAELHEQLAQALHFPAWYGKNLDALYDCLTELREDVTIDLLDPELQPVLFQVLADAARENAHLTVK